MTDQTELERLNEEYIAAFMQADVDWYQRHLAADFVCIESDATVLSKEEFLRNVARGPDIKDYKLNKVNVRIYRDAALVQATGLFTRKDGSAGLSRYTELYAYYKRNGMIEVFFSLFPGG